MKAIAFDLWETLITNTPELSAAQSKLRLDAMAAILRDRRFRLEADAVQHAYRAVWDRCQELYWSLDLDISCRTQVEHFIEFLGITVDDATLDLLEDAYARTVIDLPP